MSYQKSFFSALLFVFSCLTSVSQSNIIRDDLVIKFDWTIIDTEIIDDPKIQNGILSDVLNPESIKRINKTLNQEFDFGDLEFNKIFHINSKDTVSFSRSGRKVYVPTFWSVLNIKLPANSNMAKLKHILEQSGDIIYIDLVAPIEYHNTTDALYPNQQSLGGFTITSQYRNHINVDSAWTIETGKPWIKVGMSDSGFDTTHIDLDFVDGGKYDATFSNASWHDDPRNHGTKVAGIIGAKRNNYLRGMGSEGIAGIAGGDHSNNEEGVSLYGVSITQTPQLYMGAASIVESAYSSGVHTNLLDHPDQTQFEDFNIPGIGFGLHILNCSWGGRIEVKKDPRPLKTPSGGENNFEVEDAVCDLCYEAMEFAYRNELIVVASRGNTDSQQDSTVNYPATFSIEEAVISVGGSGYDGEHFNSSVNGSSTDGFFTTRVGRNVDVIAPATDTMITTTGSSSLSGIENEYEGFNATSAAAPHVSGVAALILSQYNVPNCYSRRNLAPEDVEEIIQRTAVDKGHSYSTGDFIHPGYDIFNGWGLVDGYQALVKSKLPEYQIIHPENMASAHVSVSLVDSNAFICFDKLYTTYGPLSEQVTLPIGQYYVDVYKITAQFDHQIYTASTTDTILGCWVRNSSSEGWGKYLSIIDTNQTPVYTVCNDFKTAPNTFLESFDENGAVISTYYYHILEEYIDFFSEPIPVNQWFPRDTSSVQMEYSLYTFDPLRTTIFSDICDSINPIEIPFLSIDENDIFDFNLFPNPSEGSFTVTFKNNRSINQINIRDITGKLIHSRLVTFNKANSNESFNLQLPIGIYLVEMKMKGSHLIKSKKLIIQ